MVILVTRVVKTRLVPVVAPLMGCLLILAALVPSTASGERSATGVLNLRATLRVVSLLAACPDGQPPDADCRARTGKGLVPGLGDVTVTYSWGYSLGPAVGCSQGLGRPLATSGVLGVAGKGEIRYRVAQGDKCIPEEPLRNEPQDFTITGGTGVYEGASGSGTLTRAISAGAGSETWTGTLAVSGLDFDVTPPTLAGAAPKTVRRPTGIKRVRVTFKVTATDAVDGAVPVSCQPRSGTRFPLGRTRVTCEATDRSGNTKRTTFVVTVKPR